jgi:ankyrin repeat protein
MADEFLRAVEGGDVAAVREMLARDPSLARSRDEHGVSALLKALYYRKADVAAILAEGRDDLDVFEAAATGRTARARELVAKEPALANALSPDGFPALGLAAFFGHADAAGALLDAGADPNAAARNAMHVAPIHAAAAAGRADIARMLLERGADANARQEGGFTALHEAANAGNLELARVLVEHGAAVDAAADDGRTPLAFAREGKHDDVARFLEERGGR